MSKQRESVRRRRRSAGEGIRAVTVVIAPVVLLAAFVWHPFIPGRLPNDAAVAAATAADTTRWGLAHLAAGVASGVLVLAFIALRSHLREAGEERSSGLALPFIVIGSTLYTLLPGIEFAPLAAVEAGGDAQAAQAALAPWFLPILLAAALTFAIGALGFAKATADARLMSPGLTWLVAGGLIVMALARFVPLFVVQLYVQGAASLVALWPLAYQMWRQPQAHPASQPRPIPAT